MARRELPFESISRLCILARHYACIIDQHINGWYVLPAIDGGRSFADCGEGLKVELQGADFDCGVRLCDGVCGSHELPRVTSSEYQERRGGSSDLLDEEGSEAAGGAACCEDHFAVDMDCEVFHEDVGGALGVVRARHRKKR